MSWSTSALLAVFAFALAVSSVNAQPTPPRYAPPFYAVSSDINTAETTAAENKLIINAAVTKQIINSTTRTAHIDGNVSSGWYATLTRADLGFTYLLWTAQGTLQCRSFAGAQPIGVPNIGDQWRFSHDVISFGPTFRARPGNAQRPLAHTFQVDLGRYSVARIVDASSGAIVAINNNFLDGVSSVVTEFAQGDAAKAWVPESAFEVPATCSSSAEGPWVEKGHQLAASFPAGESPFTPIMHRSPDKGPSPTDARLRARLYYESLPPHMRYVPDPTVPAPPAALDNRPFATAVRTQGRCGACWAFSSAAASEVAYYRSVKKRPAPVGPVASSRFSVQQIIDCVHGFGVNGSALIEAKGCQGGWPLTALTQIAANGIVMDADYRFQGANLEGCLVPSSPGQRLFPLAAAQAIEPLRADLMVQAVNEGGAVVGIIGVPLDLLSYAGNSNFATGPQVYNNTACTETLAHAVTIVGYGEVPASSTNGNTSQPFWIIKNSFGGSWGDAGYIYLARGVNMCGIEAYPTAIIPRTEG